jgi:hypothetical protein
MNTRLIKFTLLLLVAVQNSFVVAAKPPAKRTSKQEAKQEAVAAVDVKGRLTAKGYKAPKDPEPPRPRFYWELENGFKEVTHDRVSPDREISVVLLGSNAGNAESSVDVNLVGGSLMPSTIVVRPNTTLRVRNDDEVGHELYAVDLSTFSTEAISPRAIRTVQLKTPGKWQLRDRLIAHVRGYLYVIADLVAVAKVSSDGEFNFSQVPPGKYQLKVFFGQHELVSREVEIEAQEQVTLDPVPLNPGAKAK